MNKKIIDENGTVFQSVKAASVFYGMHRSTLSKAFERAGYPQTITFQGHRFTLLTSNTSENDSILAPQDPLLSRIAERYTREELKTLAEGEVKDRNLQYPKPHLHGEHFRIGVMSDTHIGSIYSPEEWLLDAFAEMEAQGCNCIVHTGDLVEGMKRARLDTQIYELSQIGYQAQRDKAVELFSKCNLPVYVISGNHDFFFRDNGSDIVEDICSRVPNMTYLGHDQADIDCDGAIIRLFHGGDGSSYAHSYRLQKLIESFAGGKKPNILFAGHVHKFCHIFERNIQAVSVPTLQMQTGFMKAKKLPAHTGFLICDFEISEKQVCNFNIRMYPLYE